MLAAILTTGLFAVTAPIARRAARLLGPTSANLGRLLIAALMLGAWTILFGRGFGAAGAWFFVSGLAGFGMGGLLMFHALPRAGSNLANLVVQCGSAVTALLLEAAWLHARLSVPELICVLAMLVGVVVGLAPRSFPQLKGADVWRGAVFAVFSALGQGTGAVLSRKAFAVARAAGTPIDPGTATLERVAGGLVIAALAWVVMRGIRDAREPSNPAQEPAWPWVLANALTGPLLGVTCMQWALSTTPAGIVQPIIAMAPLLTAPLAFGLGEPLPRRRYFLGAILAFVATVILWRVRST